MPLDLSINEATSLIYKAALGGGHPHGMAHELAHASVVVLDAKPRHGGESVLAAVTEKGGVQKPVRSDAGAWYIDQGALATVMPVAIDLALAFPSTEVVLPPGFAPCWVGAFVATRLLASETTLQIVSGIDGPMTLERCLATSLKPAIGALESATDDRRLRLLAAPGAAVRIQMPVRIQLDEAIYTRLQVLAMATTVPESDLSRSRGAGAAIDDSI